ncbi:MAG: DUF1841 family protein [Chloroflexi bacterium]|nr:DUF1841 family protein [Chloroflexota bacterium]
MEDRASPQLNASILQAVETQLRDATPPEVKESYDRLIAEGYSGEEARRLIGAVLATEIYTVLKNRKEYSAERYVQMLRKLPDMPWE